MQTERRRPTDNTPRATYARCNVRGQCELVRIDSLAHAYMLSMGFQQLDATDGCALLRPPIGWADMREPRA